MSTPTHRDDVVEEKILDYIYDLFPDSGEPVGIRMFNIRETLPRSECYVEFEGKCYRLFIERHPHSDGG